MTDPVTTGGGNSTGAPPAAPAQPEFQVPQGKVLIDEMEHRRTADRIRGMQSYYDAGTKLGIKDPKGFEKFAKLADQGVNLDMLVESFKQPVETEQQPSSMSPAEIDKYLSSKGYLTKDQVDQQFTKHSAKTAHERAVEQERAWLKTKQADLLGEDATDWDKFLVENAVRGYFESPENRPLYPEGHPLAGETFAAYDEAGLGKKWESIAQIRAKSQGDALAAKGDAVNRGASKTVAGASGTKAPSKTAADEKGPAIGTPEHKRQVQAAWDAMQKRRAGSPTSAAG